LDYFFHLDIVWKELSKEEKNMSWIDTLEKYWDTWEILLVIIPIIIWQLFKK
tara:strand:+ start:299 stop:454 length:156 start_codon:yes stop_codon:yes gene_type:complete